MFAVHKSGELRLSVKGYGILRFFAGIALKIVLGLGICVILLVHRLWVRPQDTPGSEYPFAARGLFLRDYIMPNSPIRTNFYIDGFNVYHRIQEYLQMTGIDYRWLNYRTMLQKKLKYPEVMGEIYFFTAIKGDVGKVARHNALIKALENEGVKVIYGRFKEKKEKQTDVNIAVQILMDAFDNSFARCFLMSADSDLVSAVRTVQMPRLGKEAGLITPPYERGVVDRRNMLELSSVAFRTLELKFEDFRGCSFPATINTPQGGVIKMPKGYSTF